MRFDICGACVVKCFHVHCMYEGLVKSCVVLVCFRLAWSAARCAVALREMICDCMT